MISKSFSQQSFSILKILPDQNQDIYSVLYSKQKSKKGKIISNKGIELFFHTLIIEEENEFAFLNAEYEINNIKEFKLDFDCAEEAMQKIVYYMYFKRIEIENLDVAINILQLCFFFKNFSLFQKICNHVIDILKNISEEENLKIYIGKFSQIYIFCKKNGSAQNTEKSYELCLKEIFLQIFNQFFKEQNQKKSLLKLFDDKYFEDLQDQLANDEFLKLFEFVLAILTNIPISIEEKLEFFSKFLIRINFKEEQKKKEYIKSIFNSEFKLNGDLSENVTEYKYLSDLHVFEEDDLKNIILNVSLLKNKSNEDKIKTYEESVSIYEQSNRLLKTEISSLNITLLEGEELIDKLNTTIKNLEEKLNLTSEELTSKKSFLNECSNIFVNQELNPQNLKSFILSAQENEKEISVLKAEIQNKNFFNSTQRNTNNIFSMNSRDSGNSSGNMTHDGPRCLDGSLDMRYAANRGKNKYND